MSTEAIELSTVAAHLDLGDHELISLVGGGGKTTLLFAISGQLTGRRIITTTTKMGREQRGDSPVLIEPSDGDLTDALDTHQLVQAWGSVFEHKAVGVSPDLVDRWFGLADHVVVEADGARRRPFKAPKVFEPPIPSLTTTTIAVIGADALGRVIHDRCFRPLRLAAAAECSPWERLTPQLAARALTSPRGSRKNVPDSARFVVVVTKVSPDDELAHQLLAELATRNIEAIAISIPLPPSEISGPEPQSL